MAAFFELSLTFPAVEIGGEGAELGGCFAGGLADGFEAAGDGRGRGVEFQGDPVNGKALEAVEAEHGEGSWRGAEVESPNDGHRLAGRVLGDRGLRLRVELSEQFTGGLGGPEGGVLGEVDGRVEREESGFGVREELAAGGIEVVGRRGEENETVLEACHQLGDSPTQVLGLRLDREENGDGVGRPGTDLAGVENGQYVGPWVEFECAAQGSAKAGPTQLPDHEVGGCQRDVRAPSGLALADRDEG